MDIRKTVLKSALCLAVSGLAVAKSQAADVNLDIGIGSTRPPVVVQRPAEVGRRWVPEAIIRKEEKVLVHPGRVEKREERVVVEPARIVKKEERVLVPEHVEKRREQVIVKPATVAKQWVPPVVEEVRVGPVAVKKTVKEGFFTEVTVPPVTETVVREVVVPAHHDVVVRDVEIPARHEVRIVEVPVPPRYETVYKDVVVPGHYEEVVVQPAPVVVPGRKSGIELDIDVKSRR